MTFNKMRFPIVWITLALCVLLCAIEVNSGPVDHQDLRLNAKDYPRSARQEPNDENSGEENDDGSNEESDNDGGDDGDDDDDEDEDEERNLKRHVREASQRPLVIEQAVEEDSDVIPSTDAPASTDKPTKKPSSVLLLLTNALDKAISATTKLPTQQMASDAASVFLLLGQVFSEAIDKVIGEDGPEEGATEVAITDATEIPSAEEQLTQLPIIGQSVKVEKQPLIYSSQSELKFPSS